MTITTVPTVNVLLGPPSISDPATFEEKADALLNKGLPDLVAEMNVSITAFNTATGEAVDQLNAILGAAGFIGTSTTSVAIGSGSKSFTIETNRSFRNSWVKVTDATNAANYVMGLSTYNPTTGALVVTVAADGFSGSGTPTSWVVELTGKPGEAAVLASAAEVLSGSSTKAVPGSALYSSAAPCVLTDAATVAWDTNNGYNAYVVLGGNRLIGNPTNLRSGVTYTLELVQDATGTRVPTWDTLWDFGAAGLPTLQTTASKADKVVAQYNARTTKLDANFRRGA